MANQEPVKLPREVAEALEKEIEDGDTGGNIEYIAWNIPNWSHERGHRGVLFEFSANANCFFRLIDALRYGYEIETRPITVTITPEQQENVRRLYEREKDLPVNDQMPTDCAILTVLSNLGIEIPGVND